MSTPSISMERIFSILLLFLLATMPACTTLENRKRESGVGMSVAPAHGLSRDSSDSSESTSINSNPTTESKKNTYILDGIWGNHVCWEPLRKRIGGDCRIWRYDNSGKTSIGTLGAELATELSVHATRDETVNLVGFSFGGLVVREALRLAPETPVSRVVLINSAHRGSETARLAPPTLPGCRDVIPGSPFLRRLDTAEWNYETLAVWCPGDLMVVPGWSAKFPKATRLLRCDVPAHAWPVVSRAYREAIANFLGDTEGGKGKF